MNCKAQTFAGLEVFIKGWGSEKAHLVLIYLIPLQTTLVSIAAIDHFPVLNLLPEERILLHNAPQQPILPESNNPLYYKCCRHLHHGNLCQPQQQPEGGDLAG